MAATRHLAFLSAWTPSERTFLLARAPRPSIRRRRNVAHLEPRFFPENIAFDKVRDLVNPSYEQQRWWWYKVSLGGRTGNCCVGDGQVPVEVVAGRLNYRLYEDWRPWWRPYPRNPKEAYGVIVAQELLHPAGSWVYGVRTSKRRTSRRTRARCRLRPFTSTWVRTAAGSAWSPVRTFHAPPPRRSLQLSTSDSRARASNISLGADRRAPPLVVRIQNAAPVLPSRRSQG